MERARLELEDGDFLDLDWTPPGAATVLVLHGLEGSSNSGYVRGVLKAALSQGWGGVVMHFRGCSGEPNRLTRSYHSGETGDLRTVIEHIRHRYPGPVAAVGYSLGGNVLLKYLGERTTHSLLDAAVAVSVPFRLEIAAERLTHGVSKIYQTHLLRRMKASVRAKFGDGRNRALKRPQQSDAEQNAAGIKPIHAPSLDLVEASKNFREFDARVTAPLHGFKDVDDYYAKASAYPWVKHIACPTLILQARDDPFMTPAVIPAQWEISPSVQLEVSETGGHVGFVAGHVPLRPRYWLESRIPEFLAAHL